MNGQIKQVWKSIAPTIFESNFQTVQKTSAFIYNALPRNLDITSVNKAYSQGNASQIFQALFIACWIHHPTEKGTYFVAIPSDGVAKVKELFNMLNTRPSSHLSGQGASASNNWHFLQGYHELLVQLEGNQQNPTIMLKAEGHTLNNASDKAKHVWSYVVKTFTGKGKTANKNLKEMAAYSPLIESRATENYDKKYSKLLAQLGMLLPNMRSSIRNRKMVDTINLLFQETGFRQNLPPLNNNTNNRDLGNAILSFCTSLGHHKIRNKRFNNKVKSSTIKNLKEIGESLISTANSSRAFTVASQNVFKEVRVTIAQLRNSLNQFES